MASASLNAITYAFWWHKPLGVRELFRIYFNSKAKAEGLEPYSEAQGETPEISKLGWWLKDIVFIRDPCQEGLCFAVFALSCITYHSLCHSVFCQLIPFPLGILLLLKILRTSPVVEEPSGAHGFIAARIVLTLRKLRHQPTSYICYCFGEMVKRDFRMKSLHSPHYFSSCCSPPLFASSLSPSRLLYHHGCLRDRHPQHHHPWCFTCPCFLCPNYKVTSTRG